VPGGARPAVFPPVPLLQRFMPKFAAEFPKLQVVLRR